jgi:SAM-dependent methyltransferase
MASDEGNPIKKFMIRSFIKTVLPFRYRSWLKSWILPRYCPVCDNAISRFLPFGLIPRAEARCPCCNSLERHRLIWLYLRERTDLFDCRPKRFLHIAPEPFLAKKFQTQPALDYLSADLEPGNAILQMDITNIPFLDNHFDVIYCSHVLEHVPEDRKAMREFHRVLNPSGWAILQVPVADREDTYEDFSITDPREREKHFGQNDHVRIYGKDYEQRLRQAGFSVTVEDFAKGLGPKAVRYFGLTAEEKIYVCRKSSAGNGI